MTELAQRRVPEAGIGIAQERGVIDSRRLQEQHARIALRRLDAGFRQQRRRALVGLRAGEGGGK